MNKNELIEAIATAADINKASAERAVNAFTHTVIDVLSKGDTLTLVGFGTFDTSHRAAREGRNPRTSEVIKIPATKVPRFKAGKALKDAVKNSDTK